MRILRPEVSVTQILQEQRHVRRRYMCQNLLGAHYRVAKNHRMPYLYRSISAKEPYN